jgi:hypothetical protein
LPGRKPDLKLLARFLSLSRARRRRTAIEVFGQDKFRFSAVSTQLEIG